MPKGCKPAGVALPITPLYKGEKKEPGGITCRSEGAGPTMVGGSVPLGREQAWGASERGMAGEAVQLLEAGGTQTSGPAATGMAGSGLELAFRVRGA